MIEKYPEEFHVVVIEGPDQCGKGDAMNILAEHIAEIGYDPLEISFPCYATPIGYAIRHILKNGYPEGLDIYTEEFLQIKMGMFALNRLEVANYLENIPEDDSRIMLFDRSPYSNALTIGYHMKSNPMSKAELYRAISTAVDMDRLIIEKYGLDECVLRLVVEGDWNAQREVEDLHDNRDVQYYSNKIYDIMGKILGSDRWKNVVTRRGEQWRGRRDILNDNVDFINNRYDINRKDIKGKRSFVTAQQVVENLYRCNLPEDTYTNFDDSLKCNDKRGLYLYGEEVARKIVNSKYNINWFSVDIKRAVRHILQYSENFEKVLNHIYGNDFGTKFVHSVLDE